MSEAVSGAADTSSRLKRTTIGDCSGQSGIGGTNWLITRATHNLAERGYTTALELEIKSEALEG